MLKNPYHPRGNPDPLIHTKTNTKLVYIPNTYTNFPFQTSACLTKTAVKNGHSHSCPARQRLFYLSKTNILMIIANLIYKALANIKNRFSIHYIDLLLIILQNSKKGQVVYEGYGRPNRELYWVFSFYCDNYV